MRVQVEQTALSKEKDKASQGRFTEVNQEVSSLEETLRPALSRYQQERERLNELRRLRSKREELLVPPLPSLHPHWSLALPLPPRCSCGILRAPCKKVCRRPEIQCRHHWHFLSLQIRIRTMMRQHSCIKAESLHCASNSDEICRLHVTEQAGAGGGEERPGDGG